MPAIVARDYFVRSIAASCHLSESELSGADLQTDIDSFDWLQIALTLEELGAQGVRSILDSLASSVDELYAAYLEAVDVT